MGLTTTIALAVLGLLELVAFFYLWRTNRRLDAVTEELRVEIAASRAELEERCRELNERIDEVTWVTEEMKERIRVANQRLDETIETQRLVDDLNDINDRVQCLRNPGGMSKRVRRSDHRQ